MEMFRPTSLLKRSKKLPLQPLQQGAVHLISWQMQGIPGATARKISKCAFKHQTIDISLHHMLTAYYIYLYIYWNIFLRAGRTKGLKFTRGQQQTHPNTWSKLCKLHLNLCLEVTITRQKDFNILIWYVFMFLVDGININQHLFCLLWAKPAWIVCMDSLHVNLPAHTIVVDLLCFTFICGVTC